MLKQDFYNDQNINSFNQTLEFMLDDPERVLKDSFGFDMGHTGETHLLNQSDLESNKQRSLSRIINEGVAGAGFFDDKESAIDAISNALYYCNDAIVSWLSGETKDITYPKDVHGEATQNELAITVHVRERVGVAYESKRRVKTQDGQEVNIPNKNGVINVKEAHAVRIILEADNHRDNELFTRYGFYIKTAYPDSHEEHAKLIEEISRKDIVEKGMVAFKSSMQKVSFLHEAAHKGVQVRLQDRDGEESIRMTKTNEYGTPTYAAYLSNNKYRIYKYDEKGEMRKSISPQQLAKEDKQFYKSFAAVVKDYKDIEIERVNTMSKKLEGMDR